MTSGVTGETTNRQEPRDVFRQNRIVLSEGRAEMLTELKKKYQELYDYINLVTDPNTDMRHISLALTNLEQSCMWAVKGLTK